jgi:hypothetical protein
LLLADTHFDRRVDNILPEKAASSRSYHDDIEFMASTLWAETAASGT